MERATVLYVRKDLLEEKPVLRREYERTARSLLNVVHPEFLKGIASNRWRRVPAH